MYTVVGFKIIYTQTKNRALHREKESTFHESDKKSEKKRRKKVTHDWVRLITVRTCVRAKHVLSVFPVSVKKELHIQENGSSTLHLNPH